MLYFLPGQCDIYRYSIGGKSEDAKLFASAVSYTQTAHPSSIKFDLSITKIDSLPNLTVVRDIT